MAELTEAVLADLRSVVGDAHVLTEPDVTNGYSVDWSGRFAGVTPAVVRPAHANEVAEVLKLCTRAGVAVVPQGGNTGLVGGGVPLAGEVVLSLRRLDRIEPIEPLSSQVICGAGVTLGALQEAAASDGLLFGVDLGARDSATIGGMVATNAGGIHVIRYGSMRSQVAGLECVLSDGRVLSHLAGLAKDNTGYALDQLMCGSEGTLGVITKVRLQLHPELTKRTTALIAVATVGEAVRLASHLRSRVTSLVAVEAMLSSAMGVIEEVQGVAPPVRCDGSASCTWVLVEVGSSTEDPGDELADALELWPDDLDVAVATDSGGSERLWRFRESITESINQLGVPHKLDVTLPLPKLEQFEGRVDKIVADVDPAARVIVFGHLGDGNLHVNVLGVSHDGVDGAVLGLVSELGGSISAEHGVGTAKVPWLHLSRSEDELHAFSSLRAALDPAGILNPDVLVPARRPASAS